MPKKVLILGARGNLGSRLMQAFKGGYELSGWDREEIDITNEEGTKSKILELRPDIIINTVAYNAVDKCEENEEEFERAKDLNARAVARLADLALSLNSILVHYVSDYVFDGGKKEPYLETDKTNPINRYGKSKALGEKEVLTRAEKGLCYYLIRTPKLFGTPGESEISKESFFDLIGRLSKERNEFDMVHDEEISCFTYTPDLAHATKQLIEEEHDYGIYHIINEGAASWHDGAVALFDILGKKDIILNKVSAKNLLRPARRPKYTVLKNTKIPLLRNYKDALKEYINSKKI